MLRLSILIIRCNPGSTEGIGWSQNPQHEAKNSTCLLKAVRCASTVLRAKSRAFLLSFKGVRFSLASSGIAVNTCSTHEAGFLQMHAYVFEVGSHKQLSGQDWESDILPKK